MGIWAYIGRRFAQSVLVLLLVSVATFALAQAVPGDPIETVLGERAAGDPEIRAAAERHYGFDQPVHLQYVYFMRNLAHGDLGESITTRRPVMDDLRQFVPGTIELAISAMLFAIVVGVPLGILAAINQDRWPDHLARFVALIGTSIPVFWLGLLALYVFFYRLQWLPGPGRLDTGMPHPGTHHGDGHRRRRIARSVGCFPLLGQASDPALDRAWLLCARNHRAHASVVASRRSWGRLCAYRASQGPLAKTRSSPDTRCATR